MSVEKSPTAFRGESGVVRHFTCDASVYEGATFRVKERGLTLSEVLRAGLQAYVDAPRRDADADALAEVRAGLTQVSPDTHRLSAYMAALAAGGWTLSQIASAMVEAGLAKTFTRQAVSLRVHQAMDPLPDDLPPVPARGVRRHATLAQYQGKYAQLTGESYDVAYRVEKSLYDQVAARAKAEGSMMYAVQQDILERFNAGLFDPADVVGEN